MNGRTQPDPSRRSRVSQERLTPVRAGCYYKVAAFVTVLYPRDLLTGTLDRGSSRSRRVTVISHLYQDFGRREEWMMSILRLPGNDSLSLRGESTYDVVISR
jgi:hypothetical protein